VRRNNIVDERLRGWHGTGWLCGQVRSFGWAWCTTSRGWVLIMMRDNLGLWCLFGWWQGEWLWCGGLGWRLRRCGL
jgi:hypothetical protein